MDICKEGGWINSSVVLLVLSIALLTLTIPVLASPSPVVSVSPASQEVDVGNSFSINITVDPDVDGIRSAELDFAFNASVMQVDSVTAGNLLGASIIAIPATIDNVNGTVNYAIARIDTVPVPTAAGTFATITLTVKGDAQPGTYDLDITNMGLSNVTNKPIAGIVINDGEVTILAPPPDTTAPEITNLQPAAGSCVNDDTPTISASYSDAGSGINVSSVVLWLDGGMVTPDSVTETGVTYTPADLDDGTYTVTLNVSDNAATANTNSTSWSFTVDTVAPTVAFITPPTPANNTEVTFNSVNVTVTVTEEGCGIDTVHLIWNGTVWVEQPPGGFMFFMTENTTYSFDVTGLENGDYTYYVEATDMAGNTGYSETRVVTVNMTGMCGDVNCDKTINIGDVTLLLNHWGAPSTYPLCLDWAGDVNCDGTINIGDVTLLLNHWGAPGTYPLNCC
jgi:hypothetical protein